jgi:putative ABC transport system permease protein
MGRVPAARSGTPDPFPPSEMHVLPLAYIARNLWVRRVTTGLTALGMALVSYVFATVLMMSEGIRAALVETGRPDNAIVLRKGAGAEINSAITREQAAALETLPGLASDAAGRPLLSKEPVVLNNLPKRGSGKPSNVTLRGTGPAGLALRPQVRLVAGRMFRPGTAEIVAGRAIAAGFAGASPGESLRFAGRDWQVVGVLDAGGSGFDSELWADADTLMQAFRRNTYSSLVFRLADPAGFEALRARIETDPRLTLEAKRETRFYAEQSEALASFIRILGLTLSVIFSVGAVVGATITMFAAVAQRVGEIGTLRALGFRRSAVLAAFLGESLLLALLGGALGLAAASGMQAVSVSTVNFQTFSELAFRFRLTPAIALQTLGFALAMGALGGFVPAWRAARLRIVDGLRAA